MITDTALYLGPAEVVGELHQDGRIEVRTPDGETNRARMALATPYTPCVGDELLVVAQWPDETYIIGVLKGRGALSLRVSGDLELAAPAGRIRVTAGKGIELRGGERLEMSARQTTVRTTRLNILATTIVERVADAYLWVSGLFQLKSRRTRTVTDEGWLLRAGRAHVKTTGNTTINGETIHLG